jgi:DNA-binding NtrC family response regulator
MGSIEIDNDCLAAGSERVIEKIDLLKTNGDQQPIEIASATLSQWLHEKEKQFLAQKLEDCGGSIALTARSCGIGLRSLYRKMQKYGLDKKRFKHNAAPRKPIATRNDRPIAEAEQVSPNL